MNYKVKIRLKAFVADILREQFRNDLSIYTMKVFFYDHTVRGITNVYIEEDDIIIDFILVNETPWTFLAQLFMAFDSDSFGMDYGISSVKWEIGKE